MKYVMDVIVVGLVSQNRTRFGALMVVHCSF